MTDEKDKEELKEYILDVDNELRFELETKNSKVTVEVRVLICDIVKSLNEFIE